MRRAAAVVVCLAASGAATQYVAHHFRYQPALGAPLYRTPRYAVYEPFHWGVWTWRYVAVKDPAIKAPLAKGQGIALLGLILALIIVRTGSKDPRKKFGDSVEDVHGSARFADRHDIKKTTLLEAERGVYVGAWQDGKRLRYLRHDGQDHILAMAPTGAGKGVGIIIPTLLGSWSASVIVYDIKGENWALTAGWRSEHVGPCFRFSPTEKDTSRFNPLSEVRLHTDYDVVDVERIAYVIAPPGVGDARFWEDSARSLIIGMVLHVCYLRAAEGRVACMADVLDMLTPDKQSLEETLQEMLSSSHPVVRKKAREILDAAESEKQYAGVIGEARTRLNLFTDINVARATSHSDFTIDDLVNHERPVSLYIVIPASDRTRLYPLVRLLFTIVTNRLTEGMPSAGGAPTPNRHRLLMLIDEFPSLGKMRVFEEALAYLRGFGVKVVLIAQDMAQIRGAYGPDQSLIANCGVRVAYPPNEYGTAELIGKWLGNRTIINLRKSYSRKPGSWTDTSRSTNLEHLSRPLMYPNEIMEMPGPVRGPDERITAPGQMLVFCAGHHPIRGTQMLYFLDPEFVRRAAIPAPVALLAIENGREVPQVSYERTLRFLSRSEEVPDDAVVTASQPRRSSGPKQVAWPTF